MKLRVLAEAEAELHEVTRYYEDRQSGLGEDFFQRVIKCIEAVGIDPLRFPLYEGLQRNRQFRRIRVERFPYIIIYKVSRKEILVVAIAHTSRHPGYWRSRK